jgi:alcohol dehydrogenase (cytochrome c)
MRIRSGWRFFIAGLGLVALLAALAGAIASNNRVRYRAMVLYNKAAGHLEEIGWFDLLRELNPGNTNLDLERLALDSNLFEALQNPRRLKSDVEAGERLFREHCAFCHGDRGLGGVSGPSLQNHVFRHGRSDLALYRTIMLGIPDSPMVARNLSRDEGWRLVSYLNSVLILPSLSPSSVPTPLPEPFQPVTASELRGANDRPAEWLTYSGSYSAQRHSRLDQINPNNVGQIRVAWIRQLSMKYNQGLGRGLESSPIVRGSTMFVTEDDRVLALNAVTGQVLWTYSRALPESMLCCALYAFSRGVALLGSQVFVGTLDGHLIALDASTGTVNWDVTIAEQSGGSITGAPLTIDDMVITGIAGGDYGVRGFIDARDAASGKQRWRFYTVPKAGEPGSETWGAHGGAGSTTWLTGSFDPELRLIYWGVGNPSPTFNGDVRPGDNLYSNSVVALDVDSGKLRWYFQFTPHDVHDWDANQIPVLVDATVGDARRKLLAVANRNGFYYLLDRTNGTFLLGTPFVRQTWADDLDASGRPRVRPESIPTRRGTFLYPGPFGGTNWWSPTFDSQTELLFVPTMDRGGYFFGGAEDYEKFIPNSPDKTGGYHGDGNKSVEENLNTAVKALEVTTGRVRWEYAPPARKGRPVMGGLLSTAGGIIFGSDNETFFALNSETGIELWRFEVGSWITAAPVTYELEGRQYVTVVAGRNILSFALPPSIKTGRVTSEALPNWTK